MTLKDAQINKLSNKLQKDLVKILLKFQEKNHIINPEEKNEIIIISIDSIREFLIEKAFYNLSSALNYLDFSHRDLTQKIKFIYNKGKYDVTH